MHGKQPQIVSITRQGQVTIPQNIRRAFGIKTGVKAVIWRTGDKIVVEPKQNFWSLAGSLKTKIKLSDRQLKKARLSFAKKWAHQ
ncbi:MAG: AbrB/MazE/SpoVT family DNA-binding domain-containing protein [Candidatus Doudnabacteria bacterium]|nr:AbrB/MazE/SpoVT family DNA-binding domain-containing protein [Candidatus Doudnabacteria bacterium]